MLHAKLTAGCISSRHDGIFPCGAALPVKLSCLLGTYTIRPLSPPRARAPLQTLCIMQRRAANRVPYRSPAQEQSSTPATESQRLGASNRPQQAANWHQVVANRTGRGRGETHAALKGREKRGRVLAGLPPLLSLFPSIARGLHGTPPSFSCKSARLQDMGVSPLCGLCPDCVCRHVYLRSPLSTYDC